MADLLILSIETATGCGSVALTKGDLQNGRLLAECTCQPDVTHSRRLLGNVSWLMEAAAIQWQELDGIAISLGPGSFTGLRIGMAAAKGIAMATDRPLLGVSTLDGLATQCRGIGSPLCCLLDARKEQVYAAQFRPGPDQTLVRCGEDQAVAPEVLLDQVREPTLLAGPGVEVCRDLCRVHPFATMLPAALVHPRAMPIGFIGAELLYRGETLDPATAAPCYVRASEAEINLRKRSND